jgi:hypothetical protein
MVIIGFILILLLLGLAVYGVADERFRRGRK